MLPAAMQARQVVMTALSDATVAIAVVAAAAGVWWGLTRDKREAKKTDAEVRSATVQQQAADDAAQDRLVELIQQESDKRVAIVRLEFEAKFAQQELEHQREIRATRREFEDRIREIRAELEEWRCDEPECPNRRRGVVKIGGTD